MQDTPLLTRTEAAAFLGVTVAALAKWAVTRRYSLPYIKVGTRVRYRRSDLETFLDQRTVGGTSKAGTA
jgi:excisionase family DNA binding protein